jgi:hypothetical protein
MRAVDEIISSPQGRWDVRILSQVEVEKFPLLSYLMV